MIILKKIYIFQFFNILIHNIIFDKSYYYYYYGYGSFNPIKSIVSYCWCSGNYYDYIYVLWTPNYY